MDRRLGFIAIHQRNGTVTIPAEARRMLGLDQPGAQVEVLIRDGELVLIPHMAVPADQMWFFRPEHQAAERQAEEDLASGRYIEHDSAAALVAHLKALSGGAEA